MFFTRNRILLSASLLLLTAACKKPQALQFTGFNNFSVQPLSFTSSKISLGIGVFNPNGFDIKVTHVDADIVLAGSNLGKYTLDSTFLLKANAPFSMPVQLTVKNGAILSNALGLFSGDSVAYSLTGTVRAGRKIATLEIPFTYSGHLTQKDFHPGN